MDINDLLKSINNNNKAESIGTKKEKTIHSFIKYLISPDPRNHEININKNIVDVFINNHIYEIQTKSFNLLRQKFDNMLDDYELTVVYPIYKSTTIYKLNDNDEIISIRKSPKKECLFSIGDELYKIKKYLKHPNLSFKIIEFECIEYKKERLNRRKQIKLTSVDRIPQKIVSIYDIKKIANWNEYIDFDDEFTKKDFMKKYHLPNKKANCMLNVLKDLDIIYINRKIKNSYVYKKHIRN